MPSPRQSSALRRLFKRLILCILLGAILQYAVAAAFGMFTSSGRRGTSWELRVDHSGGLATLTVTRYASLGRFVLSGQFSFLSSRGMPANPKHPDWSWGRWWQREPVMGDPFTFMVTQNPPPVWSRIASIRTDRRFDYYPQTGWGPCLEVASGWPMQSASYFSVRSIMSGACTVREGIFIGNALHDPGKTPRAIPLRIIWPGAIANTLIYAAALLVPFTVVPFARRHLRRRRGHCPACNYDLRATTTGVCPECGAANTPRAAP
ncbi:MAG: hypothetical protein IT430_03570 [Phycisphaerales bacterium]|nr:hypothetical protein [Phycisphaerales bacterium]